LSTVSALLQSGWRQGTVVPHDLLPHGALPTSVTADGKLIVLSHDCDLVNESYEIEPYVEFLVALPKETKDRNGLLFNGKNPRRLQFVTQENGKERLYEIDIHEKYRIERRILEKGSKDASITISDRDVAMIARWASRRYSRPSLPSAFVNRISSSVKDKILKKMKRDGEDIQYVVLALNSVEELAEDNPYRIILWVIVDPEICENDAQEQRANGVVSELRKSLSKCSGIEIEDAELRKTSEITLFDWQKLIRWDFDFLSSDTAQT
jgi:hypothetical protein